MTTLMLELMLLCAAQPPAPAPAFVRVAIVDNSGSMAGERIAVVRSELTKVIQQLPPSIEHPLLLVVFHGGVEPTQLLTDTAKAERAILALSGDGGGTRIAPAILQAVKELARYSQVDNVLVMLYSDGEDFDRDGILKAEAQLDALFASRSEQGLSQTVFLKRWGGANAELVERLKQRGRAKLLDAGEVEIQPVTIDPAVSLVRVHRDPKTPDRLEVTYRPQVTVRGTLDPALQVSARYECLTHRATGETSALCAVGDTTRHCTVSVPLSSITERAGKPEIWFRVHPNIVGSSPSKAILPIIPFSVIALPITIPPLIVHHRLTAALKGVRATGWADPLTGQVLCTAELVIATDAPAAIIGGEQKLVLRADPKSGLVLRTPLESIEIVKPGETTVPITFEAALVANNQHPLRTAPLALALSVVRKPQNVTCEPQVTLVRHPGVEQPPAEETLITPRVKRTGEAVWVDLVEGIVAFDAEVAIDVHGHLPHRATLTLISPGEVRNSVLPRGTILRAGHNKVHLQVQAQLNPGKEQQLKFSILPPSATPALNFKVADDICLLVTAPPPVRLVHMAAGRRQTLIRTTLYDNDNSLSLRLLPVPLGVQRERLLSVPRVTATSANATATMRAPVGSLFQPLPVHFSLPPVTDRSFFLDVAQDLDVELRPAPATPAVQGSKLRVAVIRQAPFKRLLVYLAWGLSPIALAFVVFRIVRRLVEQPQLAPLRVERRPS